jgi:hypothetical protein
MIKLARQLVHCSSMGAIAEIVRYSSLFSCKETSSVGTIQPYTKKAPVNCFAGAFYLCIEKKLDGSF